MNNKFIELDRSFAPIPRDYSFKEEDYESELAFGLLESKKWKDLLVLPRVVILAEAGAGKTEEMRATSNKLRDGGKKAFFLRLEHLNSDFETALETGDNNEFQEWVSSDEIGWFFLDSVDEAKLSGPKQFDAAIRKFALKLGGHKQRAHVYITSRLSEWGPQADLSLIKEKLPFRELQSTEKGEEDTFDSTVGASSNTTSSKSSGDQKIIEPEVFALRPLDQTQIRIFSKANDVVNLDAFLLAIEKAEAKVFCGRPEDLLELITYWSEHGKIGSRLRMVEESIQAKLIEKDPERAKILTLSRDEALYGVEMLAAASTFMKTNRILVPDVKTDPQLKSEAIEVQAVLTNWDMVQVGAFLQLPIFDEAIYGTVRFHHRSVKEFLTAKWLLRLLSEGKSRRAITNLFFAERYGVKVLVPSMRSILAWMILSDERIRTKAIEVAPEISIEDGDPSTLPWEVRRDLLVQFCSHYSDKETRGLSIDISALRRFAHPDLAETIIQLLEKYSANTKISHLLLRMIWQGEIQVCGAKVLEISLHDKNNRTRLYGFHALGVAGTEVQKKKLVDSVLADKSCASMKLIGQLITSFAPQNLSIKDIPTLIQRIEKVDRYSFSGIRWALREFSQQKCPTENILEWICSILPLIKEPPVIERRYHEVSKKYAWLLPCAILAVERLVANKHPHALDKSVLEIISLAQSNRSWGEFHPEKNTLHELVPKWKELNNALFWHNVGLIRKGLDKKKKERLTEYWRVSNFERFWSFSESDFDQIMEDLKNKSKLDDRLVALSLAVTLYENSGREKSQLNILSDSVKGVPELEVALNSRLNPPVKPEKDKEEEREEVRYKREDEKRKKEEAKNIEEWREWLKSNTHILKDTRIANEGKIWTAVQYLMDWLYEKDFNDSKWANPHWEALIPEFGKEVAEAYRDGCIDYWRKYRPTIMSEGIENPNSTPNGVVLGLNGLDMEANHIDDWPANLSENEAELACRYAVNELNGFPEWLPKLHEKFPKIVEKFLTVEIEWEFAHFSGENNCNYVLSDIDWQFNWIKPNLSSRILGLLKVYEPKHDDTVRKGLGIVIANLEKEIFLQIAEDKIKNLSGARQAMWLAAWMSVEAGEALGVLESILNKFNKPEDATDFAMNFITYLVGGRGENSLGGQDSHKRIEHLLPLFKLMHKYIRSSKDIERAGKGAYSPGLRDDAQNARDQLFEILRNTSGKESYLALIDLSKNHIVEESRAWFGACARGRAEIDSEDEPWKPGDISSFAKEAEKTPQNHRELYGLGISRLLDLKADLEDGDESISHFLKLDRSETKHRIFIGGWLRDRKHGKYNVPQEEELADGKKPDLRLQNSNFDGPVPIELKIAENYSGAKLLERLQVQLCGQYLRDIRSNCGIYLLVYLDEKQWQHPSTGEMLDFNKLIQFLQGEAQAIVSGPNKIEGLEVIGIDLTKRNKPVSSLN
ncbi:hypothetical protein JYT29_02000 [Nitrospina gracilis]|nr:hypothetical protein [Nitrospina gracilis]